MPMFPMTLLSRLSPRRRNPGRALSSLLAAIWLAALAALPQHAFAQSAQSLFTTQTPALPSVSDGVPYELGMKFQVVRAGSISALRFLKAPGDIATHTGNLWSVSGGNGMLLASVQFANESPSGWQQQDLGAAIAVQPGIMYAVSVNTSGNFADSPGGLATAIANGDLVSVADGANGMYGAAGGYPGNSWNNSNYFRDVVFQTVSLPTIAKASGDSQTGTTGQALATPLAVAVKDAGGNPLPGVTVSFTVTAGGGSLSAATGVTDAAGIASTTLTLGSVAGADVVHATASGIPGSVDFNETATAPAGTQETVFTTQTPALPNISDGVPYELGMKFRATRTGNVVALRYWKSANDNTTHTGRLWAVNGSGGTLIGQVVFAGETASGWQQQSLTAPVAITPDTVYLVSVNTSGYFADTPAGLATPVVNGDLASIADGTNGAFGSAGAFPAGSWNNSNYFRDVVFQPVALPTLSKAAGDNQSGTAGSPLASPFTVALKDPNGNPLAGTAITFAVTAGGGALSVTTATTDASGLASTLLTLGSSGGINTVHASASGLSSGVDFTAQAGAVGESVFTSQLPQIPDAADGVGYELGMKFRASLNGSIAALRFWKSPSEAGSHVGHLWQVNGTTGTLIATLPFVGESASGWQQQSFSSPVPILANQTYVVSVNANSHYAATLSGLAPAEGTSGVVNGDLTAVADGANGLYGAAGTYPTGSYQNANYFRDIVFQPVPGPTIVANGGDGQTGTVGTLLPSPITVQVYDASGNPLAGIDVTFSVVAGGGSLSATTLTTDAAGRASVQWTLGQTAGQNVAYAIANGVSGGVNFIATANGAVSGSGNQTVFTTQTPAVADASDGTSYELGMKFQADRDGSIVALRFWKGASESGTHVGHLWQQSAGGSSLLATVTFAGETASGWQQQALAAPVAITANTTYVVSVNSNAYFADTNGGLATQISSGDLRSIADGNNGLFGSAGTMPTRSYANSNYFRDVVFSTSVPSGISIDDGDGQAASPGTTLPQPLVIVLRDANGNRLAGVPVTFQVTSGGGSLSATTAVTDANGLASSTLTLGSASGVNTVVATASSGSVKFTETSTNAIWVENQKPGTAGWQVLHQVSSVNPEILGYAGAMSVNLGESLPFMISQAAPGTYTIDVYRLGWYGGIGARKVASAGPLEGTTQPACSVTDPATLLVECNWTPSYTLAVSGPDWTTGLYVANVTDGASGNQTQIWFVVRDDASRSDIVFQSAFNTYQAYNDFGTNEQHSLYPFNSTDGNRAYKVSFDRPFAVNSIDPGRYDRLTTYEYNMVRWLESQAYDVSYVASLDIALNGPSLLAQHKVFLNAGHDEYWSAEMRDAVEGARDSGRTNLAFFSGNSIYWRVRYEPSTNGVPNRVMTCYKDGTLDPQGNTVRWRDTPNNRPENALMGIMYVGDDSSNVYGGYNFVASNTADPYFKNTGLTDGASLGQIVGYEWDGIVNNGATPPGLVMLGDSPAAANVVDPLLPASTDPNISNAVRYTATSGSKVFAAGSIQWVWGLDSFGIHSPRANQQAQQMFLNIMSDLGARPAAPNPGLVLP